MKLYEHCGDHMCVHSGDHSKRIFPTTTYTFHSHWWHLCVCVPAKHSGDSCSFRFWAGNNPIFLISSVSWFQRYTVVYYTFKFKKWNFTNIVETSCVYILVTTQSAYFERPHELFIHTDDICVCAFPPKFQWPHMLAFYRFLLTLFKWHLISGDHTCWLSSFIWWHTQVQDASALRV